MTIFFCFALILISICKVHLMQAHSFSRLAKKVSSCTLLQDIKFRIRNFKRHFLLNVANSLKQDSIALQPLFMRSHVYNVQQQNSDRGIFQPDFCTSPSHQLTEVTFGTAHRQQGREGKKKSVHPLIPNSTFFVLIPSCFYACHQSGESDRGG